MKNPYVHGYAEREQQRLQDQAFALADLLHRDTAYATGSRVLEAGCGVGAQTLEIARRSPGAQITSIDIAVESLAQARRNVAEAGFANVEVLRADIMAPPFAAETFDHVIVCFVLEHLADPPSALRVLQSLLKPGGTLTVIEGDHGSTYFHPRSTAAEEAVQCLVTLQSRGGGDALIGRRLYPLLRGAGFAEVLVSPRTVYVDGSQPGMADRFTLKTLTAMVDGVRSATLAAGLMSPERFTAGVRDLARCAEPDGTFCYTFFKAMARRGTCGVGATNAVPAP